jgi:hypothetical protein
VQKIEFQSEQAQMGFGHYFVSFIVFSHCRFHWHQSAPLYCKSFSFTMKLTFSLSLLLCISSIMMPAIDARASGFNFKRSDVWKRSIKRQEVSRSLQTDDELAMALCEAFIEIILGSSASNSGCTCDADGELTSDCEDFLSQCNICDIVDGVLTCIGFAQEETAAAETTEDIVADCFTYSSGPFDNTICTIDNFADDTCAVTIDGMECNSCAIIACSATDGTVFLDESYDIDCSNVIEGETWNLCTDDLPETSRFLATANNDRFTDLNCTSVGDGSGDDSVDDPGESGGFALSFHGLSLLVSLIAIATSW